MSELKKLTNPHLYSVKKPRHRNHWTNVTYSDVVDFEKASTELATLQAQRDELVDALQKTSEALIALFSETPYGKSPFASGFVEQIANANDALLAKIGKE